MIAMTTAATPSVAEIEKLLDEDNEWAKVVPNTKEASMADLTPVAASGTRDIPVGQPAPSSHPFRRGLARWMR